MLNGWLEYHGKMMSESKVESLSPMEFATVGGEFSYTSKTYEARDCYGIYPSHLSAGTVKTVDGVYSIKPTVPDLPLENAIREAVHLRACNGSVVTLSGGVDSTLIAAIAELPALAVGAEGSHDWEAAETAANVLGIPLKLHEITADEVEMALPEVVHIIPRKTLMDVEIALTEYFICQFAKENGAERILTGQAADELFAGYARYGRTATLKADLAKDFLGLNAQRDRDGRVAAHFGVWYSLPYMDERVVRSVKRLPPEELVAGDLRKITLRKIAEKYIPIELAWKSKKAMQYGSGVTKLLAKIAKEHGCRTTHELIEETLQCTN
ncbi:MAG TPA: asparagine synthase-related protein [Methanocorpusculum sp.]|nr:asparagine synthase-related protein [Methanocorpusculum sp.]